MRRSGLTLIETLLATSILLLALVLSFSLLPSSWLAVNQGEQKLFAANLAQSLLEKQRSANFDTLASQTFTAVYEAGAAFEPSLEVQPVADEPRLKIVRVRVSWEVRRVRREVVRQATLCRIPR